MADNGIQLPTTGVSFTNPAVTPSPAELDKLNAATQEIQAKQTQQYVNEKYSDKRIPFVPGGSPVSGGKGNAGGYNTEEVDENQDSELLLRVPDWSYQDFIYERASWQKGFDSPTGEPGWFYFKIFFRFDTKNGLFGNILPEEGTQGPTNIYQGAGDCAAKYLEMNAAHYSSAHMMDRVTALENFAKTLSFINSKAPWFFDTIGGLDKATSVSMNEPLKDNILELGFREDAVDMRVSSLVDLYKYACYDYVNMKEVVPQNLRQFEMIVVLFHTPLRWYHTGMDTMRRGTFQYKGLSNDRMDDRMSYKMYTFKGCEFVLESLGNVYPSEMSNDQAFSLGKGKIQISYKRCYQHTFNEWARFMIGDDGVYWNDPSGTSKRLLAMVDAKKNPTYWNPGADVFKPLVDASEAKINWAMRQTLPEAMFGNLYGDFTNPDGDHFKMKLHDLKNGTQPGEAADHIRSSLNDQGMIRNALNFIDKAGQSVRNIAKGNFF